MGVMVHEGVLKRGQTHMHTHGIIRKKLVYGLLIRRRVEKQVDIFSEKFTSSIRCPAGLSFKHRGQVSLTLQQVNVNGKLA